MTKKYSVTFKANVVQKVREGKTVSEAAREVGASVYAVRAWVRQADEAASERPMTPQEHAEIRYITGKSNCWKGPPVFFRRFQQKLGTDLKDAKKRF